MNKSDFKRGFLKVKQYADQNLPRSVSLCFLKFFTICINYNFYLFYSKEFAFVNENYRLVNIFKVFWCRSNF